MRVQYAAFCLPIIEAGNEQDELNRFLRGHRAIQIKQELVSTSSGPAWSILVEYADDAKGEGRGQGRGSVDYREILSPEDFVVFSKLRELRKSVAEQQNLPVYAVFTNEQLATMARSKPKTTAELNKIEGIGQGKTERFGEAFATLLSGISGETGQTAF